MHVLITGGAGFIGSTLAHRLLRDGHHIVIVDNVNDYYDPTLKEVRLKRLGSDVKVYRINITDRESLKEVFKSHRFDAIAHLAAQAGVRYSLSHPEVYVKTNYEGTFNILELAKEYNVPHVVFASTSSVYGTSTDMPFREDNPVNEPMSIYAATKRGGELLGANYHHLYGTNVTCLRFFTVYGPWGRPDMALFIFTDKILKGVPIDVYNNGNMKRDFTYIDDIVDGFVRALQKPLGFEILNLGNGNPVDLMEFIGVIERELGKKALINYMPLQQGDVPETYANTEKAKELLGFEAKVKIEEGIHAFVTWYQEFYAKQK